MEPYVLEIGRSSKISSSVSLPLELDVVSMTSILECDDVEVGVGMQAKEGCDYYNDDNDGDICDENPEEVETNTQDVGTDFITTTTEKKLKVKKRKIWI